MNLYDIFYIIKFLNYMYVYLCIYMCICLRENLLLFDIYIYKYKFVIKF